MAKSYEAPPLPSNPDIERTLLISDTCHQMLAHPELLADRKWLCLAKVIWNKLSALQVVACRMLHQLAKREDWVREVLEDVFLDPDVESWAKSDPI